jgi:PAS domain S-box-containing protein
VREVVDGGLPEDDADSLFQDNRGRIWVTTDHGGAYFENGRFIPVPAFTGESSPAIAGDLAGNLWISDPGSGLVHVRDGKVIERITWESTGRKDWAFALVHDPVQGGLWLGFYQSGVGYFKDGQIRASYGAADGLGKGRVTGLQLDADGTLWAATQGGLSRVKNGRVATLTTENGLPCSAVDWVMEDDVHSFWLGMGCGLVRVARTELEAWATDSKRAIQVTVFDSSDGVRSYASVGGNSPRVAKSTDGRLWFLPYDGVSVVDPLHLPFNKLLPPVHIEQIIADRHNYDASSEVRLPPLVRDLEIDYTALSLVAPEKVLFRYKLEGRDRDWQNVGNRRQAFYTDLAPGNYRFRVAACNNSGVWNEAGTFMDFFIAPAYYQTALFRTLCAAAVLALLWAGYRMRVRQLRRQQRKLRDVIETIPTFAWTALPDGSVNFVNHNWVKYTGLTAEETSGSGWRAAVHNEDLERHAEKWQASLQSGKPFESELRYRRAADEQYRWFLVRAVPLRDARGKIVEWYGTSTDIEDRKRAEQLQAELSHMNRVSMMGELSASLAHEIKQPIAAALTNAKTGLRWLARDPADVQEARAAITRVVNDGTRAAEIINHLRCFYKKAGPAERELVDINEVAREMLPLLNSEAIRYSVSMRTDLAAELPKTKADRVQLQQVFMNLMLNGIEAMKDTGGELTIKSEQTEDDRLRISISDRGVGLPSEEAGHIFDAFFTTKSQGTGMGLTITRSIIEAHGGRLWASANNGQGATFHFTLPIEATGSSTSTV